MAPLHNHLMKTSGWYKSWHAHKGHVIGHWFMLILIVVLVLSALEAGLQPSYLDNSSYSTNTPTNYVSY